MGKPAPVYAILLYRKWGSLSLTAGLPIREFNEPIGSCPWQFGTAEIRIRIWIAKLLLAAAEKLAYLSRKVARMQAGTRSSIHGRLDKRSNPRSVGGAAQGKIAGREG